MPSLIEIKREGGDQHVVGLEKYVKSLSRYINENVIVFRVFWILRTLNGRRTDTGYFFNVTGDNIGFLNGNRTVHTVLKGGSTDKICIKIESLEYKGQNSYHENYQRDNEKYFFVLCKIKISHYYASFLVSGTGKSALTP